MKTLLALTSALVLYASAALAQSGPTPEKPLVFLSGTGETHTASGLGIFGTSNSVSTQHDQTMEMTKDFAASCPGVTLTIKQDAANYTVILNHEYNNHSQMMIAGADGVVLMTDNKGANIFRGSVSGVSVKAKVGKACDFIMTNWASKPPVAVAPAPQSAESLKAAPEPVPQATPAPIAPAAQPAPAVATIQPEAATPQPESLGDIARRYRKTNPNAQLGPDLH